MPETLLWTLYHRALEARRRDIVLPTRSPSSSSTASAARSPSGSGAARSPSGRRCACAPSVRAVRAFLRNHPGGTVVALGEGLETQFERVDDGRVHWIGVDLPETAPWTWMLDRGGHGRIAARPGVGELRVLPLPRGRGAVRGFILPAATRLPGSAPHC